MSHDIAVTTNDITSYDKCQNAMKLYEETTEFFCSHSFYLFIKKNKTKPKKYQILLKNSKIRFGRKYGN